VGEKGRINGPILLMYSQKVILLFYWVKMSNHMNVLDIFYADF